jgi:hypothetical protein
MSEECEDIENTGTPGEQPGAPKPSLAGVNKDDSINPDVRIDQPPVPMPAGAKFEITKIWIRGVTTSPQNSMTDQEAEDESEMALSKRVLEEYGSGGGLDKMNAEFAADLKTAPDISNMVYWVFWDQKRNPNPVHYGQVDLPHGTSRPVIRQRFEYLPDKPFKRGIGDHTVTIAALLRTNHQTGPMASGDVTAWTEEFPHVGEIISRTVKIKMLD